MGGVGRAGPHRVSLALRDIPAPDFADVSILLVPGGAPTDPALWAREIFDIRRTPVPVRALMALRQALVPLLGIDRGSQEVFTVREQLGEEVLLGSDEKHLDFRVGVAVDGEARSVRVTTVVRLHGWRGRLYFAPVSVLHPVIVRSMMRSARRRLT